jgi:type II secretory pathway pseudopilin PulG
MAWRGRSEAGDTLIEVLISVVIMAVAVVALMEGLATATSASSYNRRLTEVQTVLGNAGASLTDPARNPWVTCATTSTYNPTIGITTSWPSALWSPAQVEVTQVQYFVMSGGSPAWSSTCTYPYSLQLVTILVIAPGSTPGASCPPATPCQTRSFVKGPEE